MNTLLGLRRSSWWVVPAVVAILIAWRYSENSRVTVEMSAEDYESKSGYSSRDEGESLEDAQRSVDYETIRERQSVEPLRLRVVLLDHRAQARVTRGGVRIVWIEPLLKPLEGSVGALGELVWTIEQVPESYRRRGGPVARFIVEVVSDEFAPFMNPFSGSWVDANEIKVSVDLHPARLARIRLLDGDSRLPIAGASAHFRAQGRRSSNVSDLEGLVTVPADRPGVLLGAVRVQADGYSPTYIFPISPVDDSVVENALLYKSGTIKFRAVDRHGKPVAHARLFLLQRRQNQEWILPKGSKKSEATYTNSMAPLPMVSSILSGAGETLFYNIERDADIFVWSADLSIESTRDSRMLARSRAISEEFVIACEAELGDVALMFVSATGHAAASEGAVLVSERVLAGVVLGDESEISVAIAKEDSGSQGAAPDRRPRVGIQVDDVIRRLDSAASGSESGFFYRTAEFGDDLSCLFRGVPYGRWWIFLRGSPNSKPMVIDLRAPFRLVHLRD